MVGITLNAEQIRQEGLGLHLVADGDEREATPPRGAVAGRRRGTGAALTPTEDVGSDHEEAVGVEGATRATAAASEAVSTSVSSGSWASARRTRGSQLDGAEVDELAAADGVTVAPGPGGRSGWGGSGHRNCSCGARACRPGQGRPGPHPGHPTARRVAAQQAGAWCWDS